MKADSINLLLSNRDIADFLKATCKKGIPFRFTAKGMSMSPFICNGDSLTIEPIYKKTIEEGDIVACITPGESRLIIHRIIKKNRLYLLKGDNVYHSDGYYEKKYVHGYVKEIHISKNIFSGHRKTIRRFFLFLNNFKKIISFLSRYKILTPVCRLSNKILNENQC